ncbi:MAG: leucine-rich repeat domain-containing protein, partial [Muribaculum intestinale]|nr:leucine-rich repeat domain-containing protein [Muribaculum intestinale]
MKKSLLAVVLMVMAAIHAYAFTVDGLNYSASGTVATLTGATSKSITKLTIPATVTYGGKTYTVDHISGNAFHNYTSLRELVIEDSDTRIASDQYTDSHGWSILGHPFEGCPLEKVYVGRNLAERLGNGNYRGDITPISSTAESMDLTIAGKSTFIMSGGLSGNLSFNGKNISNLTIGGNVVNIYKAAFKNCTLLKKVTFLPGSEPLDMSRNEIFDNCPIDTLEIHRNLQTNSYSTDRRINTVIFASDLNLFGFQMQSFATKLTNLIFEDTDEPVEVKGSVLYDTSIDSVYF